MGKIRRFMAPLVMAALVAGMVGCAEEIKTPPPPPKVEDLGKPPYPGIWIPGHWAWYGGYEWEPGHFAAMPYRHAIWVPGYWENTPKGWMWNDGHWGWSNQPKK